MALENGIQQRTHLHGAAAHIQTFDLKGHDLVVASKIEIVQFNRYICHVILPGAAVAPLPSKSPAFEMCFFRLSHRDPGRETASG